MWEDANYCWVVRCKNRWFHTRQNSFVRRRIPLAQTDAVAPLPALSKHFTVKCDECRKTYTYKPEDVRRIEMELPETFKPIRSFKKGPLGMRLSMMRAETQRRSHAKGSRTRRNHAKTSHRNTDTPETNTTLRKTELVGRWAIWNRDLALAETPVTEDGVIHAGGANFGNGPEPEWES